MQKLTIIAVIFLFSCSNRKSKIVEQIKSYKDSSRVILDSMTKITVNESLKYEELYWTNGEPDRNKIGDSNIRKVYNDYQAKSEDQKIQLKIKQAGFQNQIDSLELELKKY